MAVNFSKTCPICYSKSCYAPLILLPNLNFKNLGKPLRFGRTLAKSWQTGMISQINLGKSVFGLQILGNRALSERLFCGYCSPDSIVNDRFGLQNLVVEKLIWRVHSVYPTHCLLPDLVGVVQRVEYFGVGSSTVPCFGACCVLHKI